MKRLKLYIVALTLCLSFGVTSARNFSDESLNYEIVYHWGVIWKHAASATLEIRDNGKVYDTRLDARTLSWVDKIYSVRDTLYSTIDKESFVPVRYVKATHEKGYNAHDVVEFSFDGTNTTGICTRVRPGKEDSRKTLTAEGKAYDMLSVFYLLRSLDMEQLKRDGIYRTTVFSGKHKETLTIKYARVEKIELRDGSSHFAHHVKFSFTQEGKKKSSDDMDTWISADKARIPLMLKGNLPIGEVRVYYAKEE